MKKLIFRGKECYVTEGRIRPEDHEDDFKYYEIRHADDDMSEPVTIENGPIIVNHWGVIACRQELELDEVNGSIRYTNLTEQESMYFASIASQDRHQNLILETEAVTYYAEDMEPGDNEEESEFIANYDEEVEELLEENLNEIDLSDTNIEIEQCNNEEEE